MHSPIPRLLLRLMFGDVRGDVKMFYRHAEMCFRGGRLCNYRFRCRILTRFEEGVTFTVGSVHIPHTFGRYAKNAQILL